MMIQPFPTPPEALPVASTSRLKVLVVDDQPANLVVATRILQDLPIELMTANSGVEALTLVLRHEFAVILLDVRMPEMDGYEAATLIRDHTAKNPVPIIFLTAGEREEEKMAKGYETGAIDFLYKPVQPLLLRSKVKLFVEMHVHRLQLAETTRSFREANQRLNRLLAAVGEGVIGIDAEGRVSLVNPAASTLLRSPPTRIQTREAAELLGLLPFGSAESPWELAARQGLYRDDDASFADADGRRFPVEYSLSAVDSGSARKPSFVLVFKDISGRKAAEERLRVQAEYDFLTGLANRLVLERQLQVLAARAGRGEAGFAILFIDLDGFKPINDQHGHAVGDEVLKEVAQRLRDSVRASDICARLGGDEFAVVLSQVDDLAEAQQVAEKLLARISEPMLELGDGELIVGASLGIAMCPLHGASVEEVLRAADLAMYEIKRGRGAAR
ncbi:MAG: diguanylate cyclase [Stagnimonas sp.]|nr:diguanylate cyclase [Stagnimonas sp.]